MSACVWGWRRLSVSVCVCVFDIMCCQAFVHLAEIATNSEFVAFPLMVTMHGNAIRIECVGGVGATV